MNVLDDVSLFVTVIDEKRNLINCDNAESLFSYGQIYEEMGKRYSPVI